ncbi:hypothetical protein [Streptomyces sp. NPDC048603]|uniref:hypothetical protein n=1 Tax=Streptomyces sp. NPDC048603 TaxID=3365577 RepID=UPI003711E815
MKDPKGLVELKCWVERSGVTADRVDGYAERLYAAIGREAVDEAVTAASARDRNAKRLAEERERVYAYEALTRVLMTFARDRRDDTSRRIYATIARFNLGAMFRPGGGADAFLIPHELTDEESPA